MRIISQDGAIDVPYEHVAVIRLNKKIYFFNSNLITDSQALAEYSTEEKAEKAMEALRLTYKGNTFGIANGISREILCKVFRFPQDDEV